MNFGRVNYANTTPPALYRCTTCGAHGCKLWREYQTFADHTELVCCDCAGKSQDKDVSAIDADGRIKWFVKDADGRTHDMGRTDSIGLRVPAVPTEEGDTFWGYTSVPDAGVHWWKRLPTRMPVPMKRGDRVRVSDRFPTAKLDILGLRVGDEGVVVYVHGAVAVVDWSHGRRTNANVDHLDRGEKP